MPCMRSQQHRFWAADIIRLCKKSLSTNICFSKHIPFLTSPLKMIEEVFVFLMTRPHVVILTIFSTVRSCSLLMFFHFSRSFFFSQVHAFWPSVSYLPRIHNVFSSSLPYTAVMLQVSSFTSTCTFASCYIYERSAHSLPLYLMVCSFLFYLLDRLSSSANLMSCLSATMVLW